MGSVRLEESGEWSGGVPECRTAHAAHQQRVERGGRPGLLVRFKAAKRISPTNLQATRLRDVGGRSLVERDRQWIGSPPCCEPVAVPCQEQEN